MSKPMGVKTWKVGFYLITRRKFVRVLIRAMLISVVDLTELSYLTSDRYKTKDFLPVFVCVCSCMQPRLKALRSAICYA